MELKEKTEYQAYHEREGMVLPNHFHIIPNDGGFSHWIPYEQPMSMVLSRKNDWLVLDCHVSKVKVKFEGEELEAIAEGISCRSIDTIFAYHPDKLKSSKNPIFIDKITIEEF